MLADGDRICHEAHIRSGRRRGPRSMSARAAPQVFESSVLAHGGSSGAHRRCRGCIGKKARNRRHYRHSTFTQEKPNGSFTDRHNQEKESEGEEGARQDHQGREEGDEPGCQERRRDGRKKTRDAAGLEPVMDFSVRDVEPKGSGCVGATRPHSPSMQREATTQTGPFGSTRRERAGTAHCVVTTRLQCPALRRDRLLALSPSSTFVAHVKVHNRL